MYLLETSLIITIRLIAFFQLFLPLGHDIPSERSSHISRQYGQKWDSSAIGAFPYLTRCLVFSSTKGQGYLIETLPLRTWLRHPPLEKNSCGTENRKHRCDKWDEMHQREMNGWVGNPSRQPLPVAAEHRTNKSAFSCSALCHVLMSKVRTLRVHIVVSERDLYLWECKLDQMTFSCVSDWDWRSNNQHHNLKDMSHYREGQCQVHLCTLEALEKVLVWTSSVWNKRLITMTTDYFTRFWEKG